MPQAGVGGEENLFRREAVGDVNMPQAGFCDKKRFFVVNRNLEHASSWTLLLVLVEKRNLEHASSWTLLVLVEKETFFRREAVGDVNMPQAGFCDKKRFIVENRNHVWRDLSRLGCLSHLLVVETCHHFAFDYTLIPGCISQCSCMCMRRPVTGKGPWRWRDGTGQHMEGNCVLLEMVAIDLISKYFLNSVLAGMHCLP